MTRIAYNLPAAAEQVSVSVSYLRQAIHATGQEKDGPPPLAAKKVGKEYRVLHADLEVWASRLKDA